MVEHLSSGILSCRRQMKFVTKPRTRIVLSADTSVSASPRRDAGLYHSDFPHELDDIRPLGAATKSYVALGGFVVR